MRSKSTNLVKHLGGELRAVFEHDVPIPRMTFEKLRLSLSRVYILVDVGVPLRAVHDADEAQLERVHAPREHVKCVCARIHLI